MPVIMPATSTAMTTPAADAVEITTTSASTVTRRLTTAQSSAIENCTGATIAKVSRMDTRMAITGIDSSGEPVDLMMSPIARSGSFYVFGRCNYDWGQ